MIDDATAWQAELVSVAGRLEAKTKQARWTHRTGCLIERDFVVGAYAIRKLLESQSVPEEFRLRQVPARRFELSGPRPDPRHPDDISGSYDFEHGRRCALSVKDLCHEIAHTSVFAFFCGETADLYDGIYVSADRNRNKHVYLVLASDFIALCIDIGENVSPPGGLEARSEHSRNA